MGIIRKGRKRPVKLEIFATVCSFVVVLMGAVPLYNRQNDAKLLAVIFGSLAAGVSLTNLVRDVSDKRKESEVRDE